jgi:NADH:ubiquinone oxidoreductase subunit|tara:strand:+ start:456 stop:812 length:357 start_codon:yes stop_codon:yes gene_type:complete
MIRQIFTWWNSQTLGTFLYTIFFGKLVGKDEFGNKYYKNKTGKRWVIYKGEINASKITADWHSWMHHTTNTTPQEKNQKKYSWQKPHIDNKTGTSDSYQPSKIQKKGKNFKKYENWKP